MTIAILHVDDDLFFLDHLRETIETEDKELNKKFTVTSVTTGDEFLAVLNKSHFDIALIDIMLSKNPADESGLTLIRQVQRLAPGTLILMCSSDFDAKRVRASMQAGAYDFITKTADQSGLGLRILQTYQHFLVERSLADDAALKSSGVVGASLRQISARIPRLVDSAVTAIHLYGPSGTGKEMVADLLDKHLPHGTPFIRVNCGGLTASLLESELFGHAKGSFTGASATKIGLLEAAHNGFIFLDEISTLSEAAQITLLRVLENKTLRRIGEVTERQLDIRIISAANESLPDLVEQGRFRRDLWQRLCEVVIELKPLAERADEFDELVDHFLENLRGGPYTLEAGAREILKNYSWSGGNVRELRNCLRAMTEVSVDQRLTPMSIPKMIFDSKSPESVETVEPPQQSLALTWDGDEFPTYESLLGQLLIEQLHLYRKTYPHGSMRNFAKISGISRSGLADKLEALVRSGKLQENEIHDVQILRPVKN